MRSARFGVCSSDHQMNRSRSEARPACHVRVSPIDADRIRIARGLVDVTAPPADVFSPHARLECVGCGAEHAAEAAWNGCPACDEHAPLVVGYDADLELSDIAAVQAALTPVRAAHVLDLGQGGTPLVAASGLADGLFLKYEGQNPTGSHKDRFQAIAVGAARALGYRGVIASSTGNHGAAAAAFAARAGLHSLICLHPEAPAALASQIAGYGGTIAVLPGRVRHLVGRLVDQGWYPCTSADPELAGRANPYGAEGYKAIAFEIVTALRESPSVVALPAASGDLLYGIWRGFQDLHDRLGIAIPILLACQPVGSAPLARAHMTHPRRIEHPVSLALSARDDLSGRHASHLVRHGLATVATVEENQLADAVRRLGHAGFYVEPASALALAGLEHARRAGTVPATSTAVAVITSSGLNWTRDLDVVFGEAIIHRSVDAVLEALDTV
jgi:threonine synthase